MLFTAAVRVFALFFGFWTFPLGLTVILIFTFGAAKFRIGTIAQKYPLTLFAQL